MIPLTELKYEFQTGLGYLEKNDTINRMNLLTVIPLSGFHCITKMLRN
jgi:hypothetical protein